MSRPISLAELQIDGLSHAPFNAALLHTAALAFPGVPLSFHGFRKHIEAVREILGEYAPELLTRVQWCELPASPGPSLLARWWFYRRELRRLLRHNDRLLLCSVSRLMLREVQRAMRPKHEVAAVLHGDLEQLIEPVDARFPQSLFTLDRLLHRAQPEGLRFVILGRSIFANIPDPYLHAFQNACVMDHPYHFAAMQPCPNGPASFGVFGNTGDGCEFAQVAAAIREGALQTPLWLIGYAGSDEAVARLTPYVDGAGTEPLSRSEYLARTQCISHALWLAQPGGYRLRASGTLFDALSFGKPLVYVANPFVDQYFEQEPGIGVRCESLEDLSGVALDVAQHHSAENYALAQEAIARLRTRFAPQAQAAHLAACFDER